MLKFHIVIIKFSIFTNKNSQSDTLFSKLENTIVKIDIKSFSVYRSLSLFIAIPRNIEFFLRTCKPDRNYNRNNPKLKTPFASF